MDNHEIKVVIKGKEVLMDAIQYYRILADVVVNIYEVLYSFYIPFKFHDDMDPESINEAVKKAIRDMESLEILLSGTEYEKNEYFSSYFSSVKAVIEKIQAYRGVLEVENDDLLNSTEKATSKLHKVTDELLQFIGSERKEMGIFNESQSMIAERFYNKDFDGN